MLIFLDLSPFSGIILVFMFDQLIFGILLQSIKQGSQQKVTDWVIAPDTHVPPCQACFLIPIPDQFCFRFYLFHTKICQTQQIVMSCCQDVVQVDQRAMCTYMAIEGDKLSVSR